MVTAINLGMARIGPRRELKRALEQHWAGKLDTAQLEEIARSIRHENWRLQQEIGITGLPSNDFSFYDHVLDACCLFGAVPERFGKVEDKVDATLLFAMARGMKRAGEAVPPLEMTKWFDTNYHYLVPELGPDQEFRITSSKPLDEWSEAKSLGFETRPILIGPVSFLLLAKSSTRGFVPLELLPRLLPVYKALLASLRAAGVQWVQLDEPFLGTDLSKSAEVAFTEAYESFSGEAQPKLLLTTYFNELGENLELATSLPVAALHVDAVQGQGELKDVAARLRKDSILSAGVVDGRNVWRADLDKVLRTVEPVRDILGDDRLFVAPSCSLLHVPVDLGLESDRSLDPELRSWLAFGRQKLEEVVLIARALSEGRSAVASELAASNEARATRERSTRVHAPAVRRRMEALSPEDFRRHLPRALRAGLRNRAWPLLPTTTIGSFPQTGELRRARSDLQAGRIDARAYEAVCKSEIERTIREQERLELDVLVHGEAERNDMVQYFAERLRGFACTEAGWVQSYGTRCVRPPILYGDVERVEPMTTSWTAFARSLTDKPVKAMLTGPVTMLKWSFVRDDQPLSDSCRQIALAIRDEVDELEAEGAGIIQVDEPALREGLPIRLSARPSYLDWATQSFRLATGGVQDRTEIHTHMCYVEVADIVEAIDDLDVDMISIEAARSEMSAVEHLGATKLDAEVGPGVYDIHAPTPPSTRQILANIERALEQLPIEQLWINPDCGLKTRTWEEVVEALSNMVEATKIARAKNSEERGTKFERIGSP